MSCVAKWSIWEKLKNHSRWQRPELEIKRKRDFLLDNSYGWLLGCLDATSPRPNESILLVRNDARPAFSHEGEEILFLFWRVLRTWDVADSMLAGVEASPLICHLAYILTWLFQSRGLLGHWHFCLQKSSHMRQQTLNLSFHAVEISWDVNRLFQWSFYFIEWFLLTLSLNQLTYQVIVLTGVREWLLLMKCEYCEVAWHAEIGIKEIADEQGLSCALCKTDIGKTQFLKLMDQLVLSHANIFGVQETGAHCWDCYWFVCWAFCLCTSNHVDNWSVDLLGSVLLGFFFVDSSLNLLAAQPVWFRCFLVLSRNGIGKLMV